MLMIQTQSLSSKAEWVEIDVNGVKIRLTAFRARDFTNKNRGPAQIILGIEASREHAVHRTGEYITKEDQK